MSPRIIRLLIVVGLAAPGLARAQYALNNGYPSNGYGHAQYHANGVVVVQGNSAARYGYGDPSLANPPIYGYGGYSGGYRGTTVGGARYRNNCDGNDGVSIRYQQAQSHANRNGYGYGYGSGQNGSRGNGYRSGYNRGYQEGLRQGQAQTGGYGYGGSYGGYGAGTVRPYTGGYLTNSGGYSGYGARQVIRTPNGGLAYDGGY